MSRGEGLPPVRQSFLGSWICSYHGGQSLSLKLSFSTEGKSWSRAVTKGQIGSCILPGWWRGQSLSMKSPFVNCWIKHDINKSYHHLISESKKVTAHELHNQFELSVDFTKNMVLWLTIELGSSLVWHCICAFLRKIDCRLIDWSV